MPKTLTEKPQIKRIWEDLDCLEEYHPEDEKTGVVFRDCEIDFTRCPNQSCVKKLM